MLGVGKGETFLASDAMALAGVTDQIVYLEEGDVVDLQLGKHWIVGAPADGSYKRGASARCARCRRTAARPSSGPYRHYMQKEIFEQPRAIADTLEGVGGISPELFGDGAATVFNGVDQVLILACGTSYYAGIDGASTGSRRSPAIPTNVEIASEYRYRDSVPNPRTLVVTISQSGETADTLAALKHARALGMEHTLTICNVATSAMVRECKLAFITRAGVEIGVASTKAFTTQLVGLFLLTLALAQVRGRLSRGEEAAHLKALRHLPVAVQAVLALEPQIIAWAEQFAPQGARAVPRPRPALPDRARRRAEAQGDQLHPRRGLPGRRAQARPAGAGRPDDAGGHGRAERRRCSKSSRATCRKCARAAASSMSSPTPTRTSRASTGMHVIRMPEHYGALSPILHVVPLQLLAYHTACARGTDVDKPRNLAKSVTVE